MKAFSAPTIRAVTRRRVAKLPFVRDTRLPRSRCLATQAGEAGNLNSPPAIGFAPLTDRKLIAIAGVDATKFLQGLITASIYKPGAPSPEEPRDEGFYTAFLTAQGRVLHDVFIHPNPQLHGIAEAQRKGLVPEHSFLIEVADSQVNALYTLIRRYKLRSKFTHNKVNQEDLVVYSYWNETLSDPPGTPEGLASYGKEAHITRDSRAPDLGWRVLATGQQELRADAEECGLSTYKVRRMLRGVPEGPDEIVPDKTLPLDANIDLMGGIDFRKGCYVGQELTIRTKHRGVVRKRILPCMIYGEDEQIPQELVYRSIPGDGIVAANVPTKTEIGLVGGNKTRRTANWIAGIGNIGLAMCRLQPMTDIELPGESADAPSPYDPSQEFMLKLGPSSEGSAGKILKVRPFVPDWMRERLAQSVNHNRT
ncbi:hypothetical protein BKA67DRAFT_509104 [Truncatella angustata]|uniref:Iron-sulfur cluster assembly factor IBA57 homolog, mitochondrial n=1 Tax=Truncatella angustata TaxID=152316 RepID=A0A9P8UZQ6_9PEZI|nr:uncharacterized protein BKA67DRAFT_509104 [Truncatella angustata]KAH6661177.1 hypothetical protein BKA67DRAFT_509104 [Truncatella angustata]KAH8199852.1 hypothetical protein TruAng_005968 [Truncatella angustata]